MTISGGTVLGPQYDPNLVASESAGRQCVQLSGTGQYVQFTAQGTANSMVVRYSVPDTANGVGANYTLSLYTNGVFVEELPMTSMYSWLYGNYPWTNNPSAGSPRNFYDEVRTIGLNINPGDVIRLEKDSADTATTYDIDLVDLENVATPLMQPANSLSVVSYGADTNGVIDSTTAFENCINSAAPSKSVWVPAGNYLITSQLTLPNKLTLQGAGMWYTTLAGSPTLYTNSSRRVTLYGNGSSIHLSDFAIVGKLNYRNDSEPNDGLGGSYGTGSTIARVWVEHTKTGAWLINSSGLVVSDCRFRDTIADGINLCVGMQGTTVTNCTARGTGDDCFPIWPATYTSQSFTPGQNIITHCTAQTPFLANGGAIYGAAGNQIQDCLFEDITYGCGILISTTFPVGANTFSGTTIAERSTVLRSGGYDPGYTWRGAVQLCLDTYSGGINGVNLNNLIITNSVSDGLSVIGGTGTLTNAVAASVSIPNYGIGTSGRNGLWARNDAVGSMGVSNSTIVEYLNSSSQFKFIFVTNLAMSVTVQANPGGLAFSVDSTNYNNPQTFNWTPGSNHTLATTTPQASSAGTQFVWSSWSDGGEISHAVSPSIATNYTANFSTQYYLTTGAGAGGSASPGSLWTNSGAAVSFSAMAANGYGFTSWTGSGSGSYTGHNNPATVTMNGPISETANFAAQVASLGYAEQPATVLEGTIITPEVQVEAFDINGLPLPYATINLSLGSGTGTLAGTLTRTTDIGGIAHFNDLSLNQAGPKTLTASAAAGNAPPTNSISFMVIGSVAALTFTTQPGAAVAGVPFGQQPVLNTVDAFGNPTTLNLPTSLPGQITLTNGSGALTGTTTFDLGTDAGYGVAVFTNLSISTAGTGNQLVASISTVAPGSPVAGAVLWLDAADPTTLSTNGTQVVGWLNKGTGGAGATGTNLWFTQYNTSLQPWLTNQINGLPVLTFSKNGSGYSAGCTSLGNIGLNAYTNGGSQLSYFLVARQNEDSTGWQGPVSFSTSGQTDGTGTAGVVVLADGSQTAPYPLGIQRNHPGTPMQADVAVAPVNTAFVLAYVDNAGAASLYLTNASGLSEANTASIINGISPYRYGITDVTIGGRLEPDPTTVDNGWDGDVAEVLVYNTALDTADQATVESYLVNKWLVDASTPTLANALSGPFTVASSNPPPPPQQNIEGILINHDGSVTLTYATTPGYAYHVETTTNLSPASWGTLGGSVTNASTGSVSFTDPNSINTGQRYYRTVSP